MGGRWLDNRIKSLKSEIDIYERLLLISREKIEFLGSVVINNGDFDIVVC